MADYYDDDDDAIVMGPDGEVEDDEIEESEAEEDEEDEEEAVDDEEETPADILPQELEDDDLREEVAEEIATDFSFLHTEARDANHRYITIVPAEERVTSEVIQITEMTEAIGIRISQIENGMPCFVETTGLTSAIDMARKEFFENKSPLILRRIIERRDDGFVAEDWPVCEMTHPVQARAYIAALKAKKPVAAPGLAQSEMLLPMPSKAVKAAKPAKPAKSAKDVSKPAKTAKTARVKS